MSAINHFLCSPEKATASDEWEIESSNYSTGSTRTLRACLKRDDSRGVEAVHLGDEKDSIVSNRSNRPSVGLYQRSDSSCKARRTSTHAGHAKHRECHPLSGSYWVSMENVAA